MNLQRIDLTSLRLLLAVAQTGSITRAAQQSNLALGAASARIRELEGRLAVPLLARHARGVRLTDAGRLVVARARAIEQEMARLSLEIDDHRQGISGHLRVVANVSSIATLLPQHLARFLQEHPGVRIDLSEQTSREIQRLVAEGQADVGVLVEQPLRTGLQAEVYMSDELVVMRRPKTGKAKPRGKASGMSMRLEDLFEEELILFQEGGSISDWLADQARAQGLGLRVRVRAKGFDALSQLVAAGLGATVLPKTVAQRYADLLGLQVLTLRGVQAERRIMVCQRQQAPSPAAQDLYRFLCAT